MTTRAERMETVSLFFEEIEKNFSTFKPIKTRDLQNLGYKFDNRALCVVMELPSGEEELHIVFHVRDETTNRSAKFSFLTADKDEYGIVINQPFSWFETHLAE